MSVVHTFADSLALSDGYRDAPWWRTVYERAFGPLAGMAVVDDGGRWGQQSGIDRIVTLPSSRVVTVDEKVRTRAWPDFCLERWSDKGRKIPGWIQKPLACDYIAYAFVETQVCYLLPTLDLQRAWRLYGPEWIDAAEAQTAGFRLVHAENRRYVTECVAVPIDVVLSAIRSGCLVSWGDAA